ncbi:MAG: hypothetical protein KatS3mg022_0148 [Armatimonadota bacterium]|nr:MAG: hypothetical protein KatS3mg022_0148 [Armatimonadota bacterium]
MVIDTFSVYEKLKESMDPGSVGGSGVWRSTSRMISCSDHATITSGQAR